jgi:hypothetical protein
VVPRDGAMPDREAVRAALRRPGVTAPARTARLAHHAGQGAGTVSPREQDVPWGMEERVRTEGLETAHATTATGCGTPS